MGSEMCIRDSVEGDRFSKICDGCDHCETCSINDPGIAPICVDELQHTRSLGGSTNISNLDIESGFWRATSTSKYVLECFNEDACNGGITGDENYCEDGYEGPYCSICSEGFSKSVGYTCNECSDSDNAVIVTVFSVLLIIVISFFASYLVSSKNKNFGCFSRVKRLSLIHI